MIRRRSLEEVEKGGRSEIIDDNISTGKFWLTQMIRRRGEHWRVRLEHGVAVR